MQIDVTKSNYIIWHDHNIIFMVFRDTSYFRSMLKRVNFAYIFTAAAEVVKRANNKTTTMKTK